MYVFQYEAMNHLINTKTQTHTQKADININIQKKKIFLGGDKDFESPMIIIIHMMMMIIHGRRFFFSFFRFFWIKTFSLVI